MICGIYKITNIQDGKFYIGKSVDIWHRKAQHFLLLKREIHYSIALQNDYNRLGRAYFSFEVLLVCNKELLTYYERIIIEKLFPEYNSIIAGHTKSRHYIEPNLIGKNELVGLEKNYKPKKWHRWVYGDRRR